MHLVTTLKRWLLAALALTFALTAVPGLALARPADYKLGYGDALTITVIGQPNLTLEAQPIRPDGRIALPLVQEVMAEGKTIAELTAHLNKAYKGFFTTPHVVVTVAKFRPLKVTLFGQVGKPGTFAFEEAPTLIDAVATAGGLTERASRQSIKVISASGQARVYDLDQILAAKVALPKVQDGDIIEVGEIWGPDLYRTLPLITSVITAGGILMRYILF